MTRSGLLRAGMIAAGVCFALAANGQGAPQIRKRGAAAVDPGAYARFPGVQRHRAWLEPAVDLSARFPPVGDQGNQSSCTAWATGYAARSFLLSDQIGHPPAATNELVSPAYIYNRLRKNKADCEGEPVDMPSALNLLTREGAISLAELPYGTSTCRSVPSQSQINQASKWKIGGWRSVQRETPDDWRTPVVMDDVKAQLQAGKPVVFAMAAPSSFDKFTGSGVYDTDEAPGGMHAMVLVGYDESKQAFRLLNSWGPYWGDKGYAWVGYKTFARLAGEAYVLEPSAPPAPPGPPPGPPPSVDQQLGGIASSLECGTVRVTSGPQGRVVEGFTGARNGFDEARTKALALDPKLQWRVNYRPWPQCEAELTLARPMTDTDAKIVVRRGDGTALPSEAATLKENDLFSVEINTTAAKPFLHVIYLQADGSAVELYRGQAGRQPNGSFRVVIGASGTRAQRFQVAPPLGNEVIIAIASDGPLLTPELAKQHTERQFLTLLRADLNEAARNGRPVSAAVQNLKTIAG